MSAILLTDWATPIFMSDSKKLEELDTIINEENLDKKETYKFVNNAFRNGYLQSTGTAIRGVLLPVSRFNPTSEY